jgi:DNA (cytosine-5)-methyltransferase 1
LFGDARIMRGGDNIDKFVDGSSSFIDLFCGCGGFSLGMERAGFQCLAAIDANEQAIAVFRANFPHVPRELVLAEDLTRFRPETLADLLGTREVDVIIGGPPCQGFSMARQVDGANHGERLKPDARRHLYQEFLRHVDFFQPRIFVMENVLGLRNAAGGEYFTRVQHEARTLGHDKGRLGYRVHGQIEDAFALGVPQKRRRQLIIGVRADLPGYFPPELRPAPRAIAGTNLGAAIGDLPILRPGRGVDEREYDFSRRQRHLRDAGGPAYNYLFNVAEIGRSKCLTGHVARPHSERDLRDFQRLREGESSAKAIRRGVTFEFPYSKNSFKDRYTRQSRHAPCSTIVAHLSKDGLMFIHPTQNRSLTPREAARVQSFPDWFRFPAARTQSFRLIGNAVPPLIAEAIGFEVRKFLVDASRPRLPEQMELRLRLPATPEPAVNLERRSGAAGARELLLDLARRTRSELRAVDAETFRRGWHALLFLYPDLHPDNARDHGEDRFHPTATHPDASQWSERYSRSGWPVALELIGREAWRRYDARELSVDEFYCVAAQRLGLQTAHRST